MSLKKYFNFSLFFLKTLFKKFGRFKFLFLKVFALFPLLILALLYGTNKLVVNYAEGKIFNSTENVPFNKVGLLLGTGKILSNGRLNLFYQYRIEAASSLYKSGKVNFILVSGDNSTKNYDEPTTIKSDLIAAGVPPERIYLDYAGFRTYDSVIRAKEIFGQFSITIISQKFHNERAIYIADKNDISAVGFNAEDVAGHSGLKTHVREYFARVKMFMDILFGAEPKFMGEKIIIK